MFKMSPSSENFTEYGKSNKTIKCFSFSIHQRPDSATPEPSCVSFKSNWSKGVIVNLKQQHSSDKK